MDADETSSPSISPIGKSNILLSGVSWAYIKFWSVKVGTKKKRDLCTCFRILSSDNASDVSMTLGPSVGLVVLGCSTEADSGGMLTKVSFIKCVGWDIGVKRKLLNELGNVTSVPLHLSRSHDVLRVKILLQVPGSSWDALTYSF